MSNSKPGEEKPKKMELDEAVDQAQKRSKRGRAFGPAFDPSDEETALVPWLDYRPYTPPQDTPASKVKSVHTERGIIIPDTHIPLHDRKAWGCVLGIVKEWAPSFGVIIGDFAELGALSRHPKNKPDLDRLAQEFYSVNLRLDELQSRSPNAKWIYIEGNHEFRAQRYMNEYGQLDGMLNVPVSLCIDPNPDRYHRFQTELRGMTYIPTDKQPFLTSHSAYYHGHHFMNKHHAASHAEAYAMARCGGRPVFYGHMHTFQSYTSTTGTFAQCCGFLGDEKALAYTLGKPTAWSLGLVLQEVTEDGAMSYTPVRITNGRAIFHGKIVTTDHKED